MPSCRGFVALVLVLHPPFFCIKVTFSVQDFFFSCDWQLLECAPTKGAGMLNQTYRCDTQHKKFQPNALVVFVGSCCWGLTTPPIVPMAAFTEELLSEKLQRLLPTQVSIQSASTIIIIISSGLTVHFLFTHTQCKRLRKLCSSCCSCTISPSATSHWILYHRKRYAKQSVQVWEREILKGMRVCARRIFGAEKRSFSCC